MTTNRCMQKSVSKTIASKFKRLRYFHGMLLTEADLREEQTYFREKLKLHNRLHGHGVVWGLCFKPASGSGANAGRPLITLEPGLALDCAGNEIVVCKEYDIDLQEKIDWLKQQGKISTELDCFSPPEAVKIWVGLKYCECDSNPQPQYTSTCGDDKLHPEFSRIQEGYCVVLLAEDELPCCPKPGHKKDDCCKSTPACPGLTPCCEDEHVVILGSLLISQPAIYQITPEQIDWRDKRKYVFVATALSGRPPHFWEQSKLSLMRQIRESQWMQLEDISIVIGKPREMATRLLQAMGMAISRTAIPSEVSDAMLAQIESALPLAARGSEIILIADEKQECVLFPLVKVSRRADYSERLT